MESLQGLKSRLKAVKNVGQITKAMEVVAATKMRKAQEQALISRPYAFAVLKLLEKVSVNSEIESPLLFEREIKNTLVLVLASDKGLAGSFNSQIFRLAEQFFNTDDYRTREGHNYQLIPIGKKAVTYANKKSFAVPAHFNGLGDVTEPGEIEEISKFISDGFLAEKWDRVVVFYTNFRSALKQEAMMRQILPADVKKIHQTLREIVPEYGRYSDKSDAELIKEGVFSAEQFDYILEPTPAGLASALIPHLVKMQLYHIFLEAKASEHSARRMAMKTASDNAEELSGDLQLEYNKLRQTKITGELMEITGTLTTLS
ncbi:MAG: ATP synthase F1 subunit gamma [bacterium]